MKISAASAVILGFLLAGASALSANDIAHDFGTFAHKIQYFGPGTFLYGFREDRFAPPENAKAITEFAAYLEGHHLSAQDLLPVLDSADPKIRTLALAALYSTMTPQVLPEIFKLVDDQGISFPALLPTANAQQQYRMPAGGRPDVLPPHLTETLTVGQVATAILNIYLEQAGFYYGPKGSGPQNPGFEAYWKQHSMRRTCTSWFAVKLAYASQGTSPTQPKRIPSIQKLRSTIDKVPEGDRTWILLYLNGEAGSDALVGQDELIKMLQSSGPDRLVALLQHKHISSDPDLQSRKSNNWPYHRMCLFVLQHAGELLRAQDAGKLLTQEKEERKYVEHRVSDPLISPWWPIAAATLLPKDASRILKDAYGRFQEKYDRDNDLTLALAMWRMTGEEDLGIIVDWYYEQLKKNYGATWDMSQFLQDAWQVKGRDGRKLAAALIRDPRFDQLNLKSVEVLAAFINSLSKTPIIDPADLERNHFPAIDFFYSEEDAYMKQYPKETKDVLDLLARWKKAMRLSFPRKRESI